MHVALLLVRTEVHVQTVAHHTHVRVLLYGRAVPAKQQVSDFDFIVRLKNVILNFE